MVTFFTGIFDHSYLMKTYAVRRKRRNLLIELRDTTIKLSIKLWYSNGCYTNNKWNKICQSDPVIRSKLLDTIHWFHQFFCTSELFIVTNNATIKLAVKFQCKSVSGTVYMLKWMLHKEQMKWNWLSWYTYKRGNIGYNISSLSLCFVSFHLSIGTSNTVI